MKRYSLKTIRRKDKTPITQTSDDILNRGFRIDEIHKKREKFSNDVSNIKRNKYKLKEVLREGRNDKNRAEFGLEDLICTLLQMCHIKLEV